MALETKKVVCLAGQWVLVGKGADPVTIRFRSTAGGKLYIGAAIPLTDADDYMSIGPGDNPVALGILGSDSAWIQPLGGETTIEVLRGAFVNVPALPANLLAPAITGFQIVGQAMAVSTGNWSNAPTSFAYQWMRDGELISGASAATYTPTSDDVGKVISCRVTAANAGGSASAKVASGVAIAKIPATAIILNGQMITLNGRYLTLGKAA